jgi:hypothetical protein
MKRKWLVMGDERKFMMEVFELNDQQVNQVKIFMEQEFQSVPELMKSLIKSNLNSNQKMLASYIMGNTVGFSTFQDMKHGFEEVRTNLDPGMAG